MPFFYRLLTMYILSQLTIINVGFKDDFLYIYLYSNSIRMDYKTILQKIKNDPYFIEWMNNRFGQQALNISRKMTEAKVLSDEEEILVRECIDNGADSMSLSRDVDIYYAPYSLRNYITNQEKNDGIFWLECEGENNWGYFESDEEVYEIFSEFEDEHWDA